VTSTDPEPHASPGTDIPDDGQPVWPSTAGGEPWQPPTVDSPAWLPPELDAPVLEPLEPAPVQDAAYAEPSFGAAPAVGTRAVAPEPAASSGDYASTRRTPRPRGGFGTGRDLFAPPEGQESPRDTLRAGDVRAASVPLRVAAALLSVVIPGAGLFLRRQLRTGLIVLLGSMGCAAAGIGLAYAQDALDSVALAFAMLGFLLIAVVLYLAGIVASAWPSTGGDVQSRTADPTVADAELTETARPRRRSRLRKRSRRAAPVTSTETLFGLVIIVSVIVVVGGWLAAIVWFAVEGDWEAAVGIFILPLVVVLYLMR
jgi:hypothetical protein